MAEPSSSGLSAAQARHVLATFRHVEALLERVLAPVNPRNDNGSVAAARNGVTAEEAAAVREAVSAVRGELEEGIRALDLPALESAVSARWAAVTATRLALIALAELDGRHLTAYGAITEESAASVACVRERLEEKLSALIRILDQLRQTWPGTSTTFPADR